MDEDSCSQSYVSDELTHFVGSKRRTDEERFELLCKILKSGRLGRGRGDMKVRCPCDLSNGELVFPETVCFCDIPTKCLGIHMSKYSYFGLAFTKEFMRDRCGCNPVYYVSGDSPCTDHRYTAPNDRRDTTWGAFFQKAFNEWCPTLPRTNGHIDLTKLEPFENLLLWYVFGHVKVFDSTMPQDDSENYYMEREWRLIGSMTFHLPDVARVILPTAYESCFRKEFPNFTRDRIYPVGDTIDE